MSSSTRISLEVIDERPKHVSYSHKMNPAFRTHTSPWGSHQSGGSAGSFRAHSLDVVESLCEADIPGSNLILNHRSPHSIGSDSFGNAMSHILAIRIYEVEPDMLEIVTYPNGIELQEGIFPSSIGIEPDCQWQISVPLYSVPLYGNGLVTVSLCPEGAFAETQPAS